MIFRLLLLITFLLSPAAAYGQWQVDNNAIPLGKGPGKVGFGKVGGSGGTGAKCLLDTTPPSFGTCTFRVRGSVTLYVTASGNDSNGCTLAAPCATINRAWAVLVSDYDVAGGTAIISVGDGTYTSCSFASLIVGMPPGIKNPEGVFITGNTTTPANVVISPGANCNGMTVGTFDGVQTTVFINGMTLKVNTLNFAALEINRYAAVRIGSKTVFDTSTGIHIYTHTGGWYIAGQPGYSVIGAAQYHLFLTDGGVAVAHGIAIDCGSNAFAMGAWIYAGLGGVGVLDSNTYTNCGSVTGGRYYVDAGGYVLIGTNDPNIYFPGNVNGFINNGGRLDVLTALPVESTVPSGSAFDLTAFPGAPKTFTSINVPAGDYILFCDLYFQAGATTTVQGLTGSISTVSDAIDSTPGRYYQIGYPAAYTPTATFTISLKVGPVPARVTTAGAPQTYKCNARADFGVDTMKVFGNLIYIPR